MALNFFRKKSKQEAAGNDWKQSGSFIRKPVKGWMHSDRLLESSGVTYETKFVGAVKITESMRNVPFDQRGSVVREAIALCCSQSSQYNFKIKRVSLTHGIVGDVDLRFSGKKTTITFSKSFIKSFTMDTGELVSQHPMESISFASIGEDEYKNIVGYVSKDPRLERACFIFECNPGLADDIILTVGQAFELKYKDYLNKNPIIQPVVGKFTDPGSALPKTEPSYSEATSSARPHLYSNHKLATNAEECEDDQTEDYDHLFNVNKKPKSSTGDYHSLQRNSNSIIVSPSASDSNGYDSLNFAPGASYMGNDTSIATLYDNPIAALNNSKQENIAAASYDGGDDLINLHDSEGVYDNPVNILHVGENNNRLVDVSNGISQNKEDIYLAPSNNRLAPVADPTPPIPRPTKPPRPQQDSNVSGKIHEEEWFHGVLSRVEAEALLHQDGEFLVRESGHSSGQYVLTGMRNGTHRHLLLVDPHGKVRTRDHSFDTVPALIRYHMTHNIPICSGSSEVYLIHDVHDLSRDPANSFLI